MVGWAFVTEYMSNGSLKDFLVKSGATLKTHQLYAFARKAAAGMLHLSNQIPPILHRTYSNTFHCQVRVVHTHSTGSRTFVLYSPLIRSLPDLRLI